MSPRLPRTEPLLPSPARRRFLLRSGLVLAGAATGAACAPSRPDTAAEGDAWDAVRAQFALSDELIHMSALYVSSHPQPVRQAIERHRQALDADPVNYLNENNRPLVRATLAAAAEHLGVAEPEDIALTDSTTMGIGLVYNGLRVGPADEILTTDQDYYATHEALRLTALRTGVHLRRIALADEIAATSAEALVERLVGAVTPRTRALALTWVHSSTGLKLPLAHIAQALGTINAGRDEGDRVLMCVDGVHGFGVEEDDLPALGCDFFMAGCHKWLFGPRGTGVVWGSPAAWERCLPTVPSFLDRRPQRAWLHDEPVEGRTDGLRLSPGGFKPFEHQWALAEAFRFAEAIGKRQIAARTHELALQLKEGLAAMPGVTLRTPMTPELSAGIVCFEVEGLGPWEAVAQLRERRLVATVTPYATRYVRLAPSIRNTPAEVDAALAAVRSLV